MPPTKVSQSAALRKYVNEFGNNIFSEDGKVLFCLVCEKSVSANKKFDVVQHINTVRHKDRVKKKSTLNQQLITRKVGEASSSSDEFSKDLCLALVSANIPLWKLNNVQLRSFLQKYTNKRIPDESTLRKNYVPLCFQDVIRNIRDTLKHEKIWISIDETSDAAGQCVCSAVVGAMKAGSKSFLLNIQVLDRVNHSTVAKFFNDSLAFLWPGGVQYDNVLLFLSDAAPYVVKAGAGLKVLYPKLIHLTCLAHGLHRVAETIRVKYKDVDLLVSNVKKVFVKAPLRIQKFRELLPTLPLPPEPVLTRWGTWLEAVSYYAEHFSEVKTVLDSLNAEDAASIAIAQECFSEDGIDTKIQYIHTRFSKLPEIITQLEARNNSLEYSLSLIDQISNSLSSETHGVAKIAFEKLSQVLNKNPGYKTICQIMKTLSGDCEKTVTEEEFTKEELYCFSHAPVTSCDVERTFSLYKTFFTDRRRSFTQENLRATFLVYCNSHE